MEEHDHALEKQDNLSIPAHLQEYVSDNGQGAGLEDVDTKDIEIPRITLMQALSPQVADGTFKAGDLVQSVTSELLAPAGEPLSIIPVKRFKTWIMWRSRDAGKGIFVLTHDKESLLRKWAEKSVRVQDILPDREAEFRSLFGTETAADAAMEDLENCLRQKDWKDKNPFASTEYFNFVVLAPEIGLHTPLMLACGKTNWKKGRNFLSRIVMKGPGFPIFAGKYTVTTKNEVNDVNQTYKVFSFENAGFPNAEETKAASRAFETFREKSITTDYDEPEPSAEDESTANETEI